jgi:hypothetical protein
MASLRVEFGFSVLRVAGLFDYGLGSQQRAPDWCVWDDTNLCPGRISDKLR